MTVERKLVRAYFARLRRARRHPLPSTGRLLVCPPKHGVYIIFDAAGKVAHVGRTTRAKAGILQRIRAHLAGRSSFVIIFLKRNRQLLRKGYSYCWVEIANARVRALVEAYATGVLCPRHIGTGEVAA